MNIEDSLDPLGDIVQRSRQAQRETEQLRRDLADEQDRRRKTQGELALLRERLTRIAAEMDNQANHLKTAPHPRPGHRILDILDWVARIRKELES